MIARPRVLALLLIPFLLVGCGSRTSRRFEAAVVKKIEKCSGRAFCEINVAGSTTFDWDEAYVFAFNVKRVDRERLLGLAEHEYVEGKRQIVFLKNGRIVASESEPTEREGASKDAVYFEGTRTYPNFAMVRPSNIFQVQVLHGENGRYFILRPAGGPHLTSSRMGVPNILAFGDVGLQDAGAAS